MFWKRIALGLFFLVGLIGDCRADSITVYFYPSHFDIDWSSPRSLAWSVLLNDLTPSFYSEKHELGHATVELQCDTRSAAPVDLMTGMSDLDPSAESQEILLQKAGLGVMFKSFAGRLQSDAEIREDIQSRYQGGDISWIQFDISSQSCRRVLWYYRQYVDRGYEKHYGLALRPRYGEGSGCSAFVISFLEVSGLLDETYVKDWSKVRRVPERLIGNTSLLSLLFKSSSGHWADEQEVGKSIRFWDPDTMHHWVLSHLKDYPRETRGRATGLHLDRKSAEVPSDPFWKTEFQ
jgi:hypothetical protein